MNGKFEEASIGIFAYDKNIIPYLKEHLPDFDDFIVFWNRVSEEEKEQLLIVE